MAVLNVKELAAYIQKKYQEEKQMLISPIKLQKSLYFLFAYWGGIVRKSVLYPLSVEENFSSYDEYLYDAVIEAWVYGPVIPEVYHETNINAFYNKNIFEDKNIIIKLQHIVNLMVYTIMNKENQELYVQNKSLNKQLKENIKEAQELRKESDNKNKEIEHIKNDMKSITTTIISIILAVSIIPAAIIGIEKINPEYILPFVSTVILFGMVMITFVYSIYQDKIKISTWTILISMLIFTIVLWINSVNPIIKINKDSGVTEDITVENNQQEN